MTPTSLPASPPILLCSSAHTLCHPILITDIITCPAFLFTHASRLLNKALLWSTARNAAQAIPCHCPRKKYISFNINFVSLLSLQTRLQDIHSLSIITHHHHHLRPSSYLTSVVDGSSRFPAMWADYYYYPPIPH